MNIRLRVHTPSLGSEGHDARDFVLACEGHAPISDLGRLIESTYSTLFPCSKPLFIAAVKDAQDYLVAPDLTVQDVFNHDDHVYVLLKQQPAVCVQEQPLVQSVAQWKTFSRHLVTAMYEHSNQEIVLNEGLQVLTVLSLLPTFDSRESALQLLTSILTSQKVSIREDTERLALTWILKLCQVEQDPQIQVLCVRLLQALVCGPHRGTLDGVEGLRSALMRLSRSNNEEVKKVAVDAVRYLSSSCPLGPSMERGCGEGKRREMERRDGVKRFDTAEDAMEMLQSKESIQLKEYALQHFCELTSAFDWLSFLDSHGQDFFLVLFAVGRRDPSLAKMVAQILRTLTFEPRICETLFRYDSLHFLDTQMFYEEEEPTRSFFSSVIRDLLFCPTPPPISSVVGLLTTTRNVNTKLMVAEVITQLAKDDAEENELGSFVSELIMETFEALNTRDLELTYHLVQTITTLSVIADNQFEMHRQNSASLLVQALQFGQSCPPNADDQVVTRMQRAVAKALANLSGSSSLCKSGSYKRAVAKLPSTDCFEDGIVRMYLDIVEAGMGSA